MKAVWFAGLLALGSAAVWAGQPTDNAAAEIEKFLANGARIPSGYLDPTALPDSIALLPPPPAENSAALARDEEASGRGLALHDSPRWKLATSDADLFTPEATEAFSCAAGFAINPQSSPATSRLLRRAMVDLGMATGGAKKKYQRTRPFMENGNPTCSPSFESYLRKDGSYPSGHSAVGFGWGLIMAELVPARATELVARGRAFGDSRRVCNVHWLTDVEEGRMVAAATLAKLHSVPAFQQDLKAAQEEIAAGDLAAPQRDCAAEASSLAEN
ncbi:phosphatase [Croceicoccus estronivorus]|uniref:acid phosphatase n=1 Tax=Croceicoccus estronivorus TaxID=1172626 RepID=UPI00082F4639|nr:phosphatase PAP2 family protein [Croceicoccus estronivorus]OCC25129.1 phosphatase [Croceicoccus estronivorus]